MIKVSDFIAERLKNKHNIDTVFMVSGGGAMHLNDSFGKYLNVICNHNEQASSLAAEGYSRTKGLPVVVNVTTGPGGLNALNGLFGAWTDSVPLIFISGQVKFSTTIGSVPELKLRQLGDQEADIISVVKPLTKFAYQIRDPQEVEQIIDRAVFESLSGRKGPVWIDIPHNIQSAMIEPSSQLPFLPSEEPTYSFDVIDLLKKIEQAKRPVVVVGHGVRLSDSIESVKEFLKKVRVPVLTTFNGFDIIPEDFPTYIGRIGTIGQRAANLILQNSDLVLFLGTRNNIRQISYNWENFVPNAYSIAVDIDEAELKKPTFKPTLAIHSDLRVFLKELNQCATSIEKPDWLSKAKEVKENLDPNVFENYCAHSGKIHAYKAVQKICEGMLENEVCVLANATPTIAAFQLAKIKRSQRFISNSGDASMGYDLPAALGAAIALPGKQITCIAGDGSIMMNLQELQTIVHHNLPIKIFIINNNGYSSIKQTQNNFFEGRHCGDGPESGVSLPDFVKVGKAFGIPSTRVETIEQLDNFLFENKKVSAPVICEVVVDPDYIFTPKLAARKKDDGTLESPSLENMFPFLSELDLQKLKL